MISKRILAYTLSALLLNASAFAQEESLVDKIPLPPIPGSLQGKRSSFPFINVGKITDKIGITPEETTNAEDLETTNDVEPQKKKVVKKIVKKKKAPPRQDPEEHIIGEVQGPPVATPQSVGFAPQKRPDINYKTKRLPNLIYRKSYSNDNAHLPSAQYEIEYKKLLFASIANNRVDLIRTLVDYFKTTEIRDPEGNTPLIYATMVKKQQSIMALLALQANVNAMNYAGINALTIALQNNDLQTTQLLLNAKADADRRTIKGYTALHTAATLSNNTVIELLLNNNADPNIKTKKGNSPLHIAVAKGNTYGTYMLINHGSYIESRNFEGDTPLMVAAKRNQQETASILLSAGANIGQTDAQGQTTRDIALAHKSYAVIQLLESELTRRKLAIEELIRQRQNTLTPSQHNITEHSSLSLYESSIAEN